MLRVLSKNGSNSWGRAAVECCLCFKDAPACPAALVLEMGTRHPNGTYAERSALALHMDPGPLLPVTWAAPGLGPFSPKCWLWAQSSYRQGRPHLPATQAHLHGLHGGLAFKGTIALGKAFGF